MATTATFTPAIGQLSLVGDPGAQQPFAGGDPLAWRLGADTGQGGVEAVLDGAFTVTASGGQVRVFRAFLDTPRTPPARARSVAKRRQ